MTNQDTSSLDNKAPVSGEDADKVPTKELNQKNTLNSQFLLLLLSLFMIIICLAVLAIAKIFVQVQEEEANNNNTPTTVTVQPDTSVDVPEAWKDLFKKGTNSDGEAGVYFENSRFRNFIPDDWTYFLSGGAKDTEGDLVLQKDGYELVIISEAFFTDGGWGFEFDAICSPAEKNYPSSELKANLYRHDGYITTGTENSEDCPTEMYSDTDFTKPVWQNSVYSSSKDSYGGISQDIILGLKKETDPTASTDLYGIIFSTKGYSYNDDGSVIFVNRTKLPNQGDPLLDEILAQVDELVMQINFK